MFIQESVRSFVSSGNYCRFQQKSDQIAVTVGTGADLQCGDDARKTNVTLTDLACVGRHPLIEGKLN